MEAIRCGDAVRVASRRCPCRFVLGFRYGMGDVAFI